MQTFNIRLVNKHLLFDYEGLVLMVDTGAPVIFNRHGNRFQFLGRDYSCLPYAGPGVSAEKYVQDAGDFIGENVDVMIGNSVLGNYKYLIDYHANTITLYEKNEAVDFEPSFVTPLKAGGHIGVNVSIAGRQASVALDTGAIISYINPEFTDGIDAVRTENDFNYQVGDFTTEIYPVTLDMGDDHIAMECGVLPAILRMGYAAGGFAGVIGWDFFSQRKVLVDPFAGTLSWSTF